MEHPTKLLFICSQNKWRSRTAEEIFRNEPGFQVKSAGTEPSARIRVTEGLVGWADEIFVMEKKHRAFLEEKFSETLVGKSIHCLNIPDDYKFMDPDLVAALQVIWEEYLERRANRTNDKAINSC